MNIGPSLIDDFDKCPSKLLADAGFSKSGFTELCFSSFMSFGWCTMVLLWKFFSINDDGKSMNKI